MSTDINGRSAPKSTQVIVGLAVAVFGLGAAILGFFTARTAQETARIGNETQRIAREQAEIEAAQADLAQDQEDILEKASELDRRADDLEARVNNVVAPGEGELAARNEVVARSLSGTWEGSYRCTQGLTGLTLTIYIDDDDSTLATFDFYPHPSNSDVPSGTLAMEGGFSIGQLSLVGDYWIERPDGYRMVDLDAALPDAPFDEMSGGVSGAPDCENFEVRKVSSETRKPPV